MNTNLKARRIELGLTLEQVGKMVGVGKSTVRKWETGYIENMGRDKIIALSKALRLNPMDIIDPKHEFADSTISEISSLVKKLNTPNRKQVYKFAKKRLQDQINNDSFDSSQPLAAHADSIDQTYTKKDIKKRSDFLEEEIKKYNKKNGK